jgi:ABC-type protease/lipase transport system fused ATPase/permease subunit
LGGTISQNISRFSLLENDESEEVAERVVAAAMAAGAHDVILRLPHGYNTVLDNSGRGLSAGQAQRIALARALFGDPVLLVMDEPNSALDSEGEASLCVALAAARTRGATVIVVAHRVGILGEADKLAILREGMLVKIGRTDEVLAYLRGGEQMPATVSAGKAQI